MIIDGWMITLSIFILGLVWKASTAHSSVKSLKDENKTLIKNDTANKERINELDTNQIKIIEALERTYATEKFVYEVFITRREHGDSMERLEEKLVTEMSHMNETLEKICNIIEKRDLGHGS